ncbi:MAG: hypothetical protein ACI9HK_004569, partial [Pirellulaceae bacterium]
MQTWRGLRSRCDAQVNKRFRSGRGGSQQRRHISRLLCLEALESRRVLAGSFLPAVSAGDLNSFPIDEAAGLTASQRNANVLWTHNDAGDSNRVLGINSDGQFLGSFQLQGATNVDFEDIAVGVGPTTGVSYLYVGDIGDSTSSRADIQVYRVAEPQVDSEGGDQSSTISAFDTLTLSYPD